MVVVTRSNFSGGMVLYKDNFKDHNIACSIIDHCLLPTLQLCSFLPHGSRCQKFIKFGVKNERGRSGIDIIYKNKRKFSWGAVVPHSDAIGPTLPGTDEHNNNHVQSAIGLAVAASMAIQQYCPQEVQTYVTTGVKDYVLTSVKTFLTSLPKKLTMTMIINEYDGRHKNEVFTATDSYLASRASLNIQNVAVAKDPSDTNIKLTMGNNERYTDTFKGVKFKWCLSSETMYENGSKRERRSFELTFHRRHNNLAVNEYLPFILEVAETIEQEERMLKLYSMETWYSSSWASVNLDHPSTFDTLAMDADVKEKVIKDLDRFVERREYYRKVGKAWKRGYLLYGPPGTGKSSLIAAMANYLKFDIYDLELTAVHSNSTLQELLLDVGNPSILVVEDIDCSIELHDRALNNTNRARKVTLSGFLNVIDGLWSSCGDERIIVFTTNHKEKLDPALIRPGRMDVHIEMSYCTPCGFRVMASNYLDVTEHETFERIDYLLGKLNITPAQIGEQLIRETDPDLALGGLVQFLDETMEKQKQENIEKNKKADRGGKEKKGKKSV